MTMTTHMRAALLAILLCVGSLTPAPASADVGDDARVAHQAINAWKLVEADRLLEALEKKHGEDPEVLYLKGRHAFMKGDYEAATALMDQALTTGEPNARWAEERDIVKATGEVTRGYEKHLSPKGYFEIALPKGKDRVLLPYAFEALDEAYEVLGEELGMRPPTPVRVEFYPDSATLAKVSTLSDEAIRTTGTIALCKYNRLMATSPNALLQGYGWVDTVVHEYVHFVIHHKTVGEVPIWMHEGMAKFLERRWRGEDEHRLPPTSEQILSKRFKDEKLVTFEQMHPSMALLPTAEDAAVAYAQVYTIMEYLHQEKGAGSLAKVLEEIDRGKDAREAYAAVLGIDFATFESTQWPEFLSKRPEPKLPDDAELPNELKFKDSVEKGTSELDEIPTPAARDHAMLGQMLQTRGRYGAAAVQYQKALRLEPTPSPVLAARMGSCLSAVGKFEDALRQLAPLLELYPSYVTLWLEIGRAAVGAGKFEDAREYWLEAARINPFNPEVHQLLAKVFENLGDKERAKQERELSSMVM